jgi:N-acetylmuramoyl-L-alanine amidase
MKRKTTATDAAIVMVSAVLLMVVALGVADRRQTAAPAKTEAVILIDAGHGGADGGAVAADGTPEKELNLAVALTLQDLLRVSGYRVEMTRDTDVMLDTEGDTLRERKISDLHNRLQAVERAALTVSIHQNKFEQPQYYGTQVFYSPNHPHSKTVAEAVRGSVVALLQPNNTRPLKAGDSSVLLLHRATTPMILVECGFLSNAEELQKLKDPVYQRQLAFAVCGGVMAEGVF